MIGLPDPGRSRAVLIGASSYSHLEDLPAVRNNLDGLRDVLVNPALGGLLADACTVLEEPSSGLAASQALRREASAAEDTLLVYFAGHGKLGIRNELYLCLPGTDPDPDSLWVTTLPYEQVRAAIAGSRATKKVVILDCCFSGQAVASMAGDEDSIVSQVGIEGTYVLTATPPNIKALAPAGERYTAFTGVLLELLRTGVPGGPKLLTFATIFPHLKHMLISRQLPEPRQGNTDTIAQLALTRNPAYTPDDARPPQAGRTAQSPAETASDRAAAQGYSAAGRGADVETEARLSFMEAKRGTSIQLRLADENTCGTCHGRGTRSGVAPRTCQACDGTGQISRSLGSFTVSKRCRTCQGRGSVADDPCLVCGGSGRIATTRTLLAGIPAGIKDGQRVRVKGRGGPGSDGGPDGDLYVRVHVEPLVDPRRFDNEPATPDRHRSHRPGDSPAVAFDFGTTYSAVAVLEGGEPVVIANAEGSPMTPSVVAFAKDGVALVGEVAKRQAVTNGGRTIRSVKGQLGTEWSISIDGKKFTAPQISAFVLQKLKRDAETSLGMTITDAVITVPAYFNDAQRQATRQAGQIAGLNVLRMINEPTSAALAYHLEQEDGATVLVFHLGGGTFGVSVLEMRKGMVEVRAASGDNHLGGEDWDQRIVYRLMQDFKNSYGIDLSKDKMALQRLLEAAETAKIDLSSSPQTLVNLPYITHSEQGPLHLDARLTRDEFQRMTADLLDRCREPFQQAIKDAGVRLGDIDHVVLAGGSMRMPSVVTLVRELTGGKSPGEGINPDEVVALGGALQAGALKGF